MSDAPAPPWVLPCPWCPFAILVAARGRRGAAPGAGEEAAQRMEDHVVAIHRKTWAEFLGEDN